MIGVLLALGASLSWGVADFGAGVASRRLAIPLVIATTQAAGLVFVTCIVAIFHPHLPSGTQFAWGALAGVVGIFGLSAFYRALEIGAMGIVGPLSATAAVVPLAAAVVLVPAGLASSSPQPARSAAEPAAKVADPAMNRLRLSLRVQ